MSSEWTCWGCGMPRDCEWDFCQECGEPDKPDTFAGVVELSALVESAVSARMEDGARYPDHFSVLCIAEEVFPDYVGRAFSSQAEWDAIPADVWDAFSDRVENEIETVVY